MEPKDKEGGESSKMQFDEAQVSPFEVCLCMCVAETARKKKSLALIPPLASGHKFSCDQSLHTSAHLLISQSSGNMAMQVRKDRFFGVCWCAADLAALFYDFEPSLTCYLFNDARMV